MGLPKTRNPAKTNATQQKPTQSWQKPPNFSKSFGCQGKVLGIEPKKILTPLPGMKAS